MALTIAGSDNCAGAGIQADLKTFSAFGVYGLTALTTVVAEIPGHVKSVFPLPPDTVRDQIELSFSAFPVQAVKTGMLWSVENIELVHTLLKPLSERGGGRLPVVVDPVMVASSGDSLLKKEAVAAYKELLFGIATLVTPNLDEASVLIGRPISTLGELLGAGKELAQHYGSAFLMKGGHFRSEIATDMLILPDRKIEMFEAKFNPKVTTHGTGCTFSAAIAAGLASRKPLSDAVSTAKHYISRSINHSFLWDETPALNHFSHPAES